VKVNNPIWLNDSTPSTSPTTGALVIDSGLGVGGAVHAGAMSTFAGITTKAIAGVAALYLNGVGADDYLGPSMVFQTNGVQKAIIGTSNALLNDSSDALTFFQVASLFRFYGLGAGTLTTDADGNVSVSSDGALKEERAPFTRTIADLIDQDGKMIAPPKAFRWRAESGLDTERDYVGFFAEEYERGVPEAIGRDPRGYRTFSDRVAVAVLHNTAFDHEARLRAIESKLAA
jgi:hypothetical protein